jgi:hypothetical protein
MTQGGEEQSQSECKRGELTADDCSERALLFDDDDIATVLIRRLIVLVVERERIVMVWRRKQAKCGEEESKLAAGRSEM